MTTTTHPISLNEDVNTDQHKQHQAVREEYLSARAIMTKFMSASQLKSVDDLSTGEEGQFFIDTLVGLANIVKTMPKTMEQDENGDEAIAYLHYFKRGVNFYIAEKDVGDSERSDFDQHQAFGLADIGCGAGAGAELGYISIAELIKNNVELDFYFKPTTIAALQSAREPDILIVSESQFSPQVTNMIDAVTAAGGREIDAKEYGAVAFTLDDECVLLSKNGDAYRITWLVDNERKFTRYCADPAYAIDEYRQGYDAANDDENTAGPGH